MLRTDTDDWQAFNALIARVTPLSDDGTPQGDATTWAVAPAWILARWRPGPTVEVDLGALDVPSGPFALEWWDLPDGLDSARWRHVLMPLVSLGASGDFVASENPAFKDGPETAFAEWPTTERSWQWMFVDEPPGVVFEDDNGAFAGWAAPAPAR